MLVANKAEKTMKLSNQEVCSLGFGKCLHISAEHKIGFDQLYNELNLYIPASNNVEIHNSTNKNLTIAIIGRPNVGKSTFFNQILGKQRSLVSEFAGTTRDSVNHEILVNNQYLTLIDTAGARRKGNVTDKVECLAVKQTIAAIKKVNIIIQVMDANNIFEKQDLRLSNLALDNKSLFIILINKIDLIKNMKDFDEELKYLINKKLSQFKDVKVIYTSFKKKFNRDDFFCSILDLWEKFNLRIPTKKLNEWLEKFLKQNSLPIVHGNTRLKIKYIKQSDNTPPNFIMFINIAGKYQVNPNFHRFILQDLKESFDLNSIPINITFKASSNPFKKD